MKRIFVVCLIIILTCVCFVSCGNRAILDPGNFSFTHVHMTDYTEGHCCDIDKWWENESGTGVEVRTTDGKGIFLSEGTYQMFESKAECPYCK